MHHTAEETLKPEVLENLRLELRRGCLILAVLGALRTERYGYTLRKALAEQGMEIDEGTLYPLLRRLESQGLLVSEWREEEKRNKRFYRLSAEGKVIIKQLDSEWKSINWSLEGILYGAAYGTYRTLFAGGEVRAAPGAAGRYRERTARQHPVPGRRQGSVPRPCAHHGRAGGPAEKTGSPQRPGGTLPQATVSDWSNDVSHLLESAETVPHPGFRGSRWGDNRAGRRRQTFF